MQTSPLSAHEAVQSNNEIPASLLVKANQEIRKDFPLFSSLQITDFKPLTGGFWSLKEDATDRIIQEYISSIETSIVELAKSIALIEAELAKLKKVLAELPIPDIARRDSASAEGNRLAQEKSKPENKGKGAQDRLEKQKRAAIAIVDEVKTQERAQKNAQAEIDACITRLNAKRTEELTMAAAKTDALTSLRERLESLCIEQPAIAVQPVPVAVAPGVKRTVSRRASHVRTVVMTALALSPLALIYFLKKDPEKTRASQSTLVSPSLQRDIDRADELSRIASQAESSTPHVPTGSDIFMSAPLSEAEEDKKKSEAEKIYADTESEFMRALLQSGDISTSIQLLDTTIRKKFGPAIETINITEGKSPLGIPILEVEIRLKDGLKITNPGNPNLIALPIGGYIINLVESDEKVRNRLHAALHQFSKPEQDNELQHAVRTILAETIPAKNHGTGYAIGYNDCRLGRDLETGRPYVEIFYAFDHSTNRFTQKVFLGLRTSIPEIDEWLKNDGIGRLTPEQYEECQQKINIVKKYPDLMKKYSGNKIVSISLIGLLCEVPEEFENFPHVKEKIKNAWGKNDSRK